ncbi:MAG: GIY-YIG nuclease family protein [Formosimonas sp.]
MPYVYLMSNAHNTVLYIGVTSDLIRRVAEHKAKIHKGFTQRYNVDKLVYFETAESIRAAIAREKQLKNWQRAWKNDLIATTNPNWLDLSDSISVTQEGIDAIKAQTTPSYRA